MFDIPVTGVNPLYESANVPYWRMECGAMMIGVMESIALMTFAAFV